MKENSPQDAPKLDVRGLVKRFDTLEVLKGISLKAYDHDVISILGPSGSGKSTFLRCINFLETPTEGEIIVDGEQVRLTRDANGTIQRFDRKQVTKIRSELGMVFQNFNLWTHMTVLENVIEGPIQVLGLSKSEAIERAKNYMDKVGVYERRNYYPSQISGGQQQRAAIARTLAMRPKVLLFDEPTSALDPELVGEVLKVIRQLASEGRTMLIVTHEIGFARDVSDKIVFFDQGLIEAQGTVDEAFSNPENFSERWGEFISRTLN